MIRNSFIFLEKIDKKTEQNIWNQGIASWEDFLNAKKAKGISSWRKRYYNKKIMDAKENLYSGNADYFLNKLPLAEQWRLYGFFKEECVYLDIETNGIAEHAYITVIGLYDGYETKLMIKDINMNLDFLRKYLLNFKMLVTFNGSVFDMPFILKRHPDLLPRIPHFDLRFCCSRIGLTGGLKEVERKLGIKRENIVEKLVGGDALTLWRMFKGSGDDYYLNLLVQYNEEDVINLKTIAEHVYESLKKDIIPTNWSTTPKI